MPDQILFAGENRPPCRSLARRAIALVAVTSASVAALYGPQTLSPGTPDRIQSEDTSSASPASLSAQQIVDALLNDSLGRLSKAEDPASDELICTGNSKAKIVLDPTVAATVPTDEASVASPDTDIGEQTTGLSPDQQSLVATSETISGRSRGEVARLIEHTVESGDTLSRVFADQGLSPSLLAKLLQSGKEAKQASRLVPGQKLRFALGAEGELRKLIIHRDALRAVEITYDGNDFRITQHAAPLERKVKEALGIIETSLFAAAVDAGLPNSIAVKLAELFSWDIDFSLDIRPGDRFTVIYETGYLDGEEVEHGPILAAEFVNQGVAHRVVRYTDPLEHTDYYRPDGQSIRRSLLRSPVKFTQITSGFSKARKHPILKRVRAHTGVDYAAPIGTPVRAAGDGAVSYRGFQGGYGMTVVVEHRGEKSTLYAHLSGFAKEIDVGKKVRQGDIIGYVGQSGLASGPHLHYEYRVKGEPLDPLTAAVVDAEPLQERFRSDFSVKTAQWIAELDAATATRLAYLRH